MKNFFKSIFSTLLILCISGTFALAAEKPPEVRGEGMILIDANTGDILADKNSNEKFAPASTTKLMTALLVLENAKLDEMITVGAKPPFAEGSSIALKEGDTYSVENILHALLLESANDAAMSLAEHISGTEADFAKLMTKRAKELGAKNTNFVNSSGLYEETHYTTAYDLSLIMKEILKHEDYIRISRLTSYELPVSKVDGETKWVNNTTTLFNPNNANYFEELIAGKTGYTNVARCSYVSAAKKDGQTLISVLLKAETKTENFEDTKALFSYGFENFDSVKIYDAGDTVTSIKINKNTEIPLITNKSIYYLVDNTKNSLTRSGNEGVKSKVKTSISLEQKDISNTSFNKGDEILHADILVNNKPFTNIALVSGVSFEPSPLSTILNFLKSNFILWILLIIAIIICIFVIKEKFIYHGYRKRHKKILFKNKNKRNKLRF